MIAYLWIALGSALGGMARYACTSIVGKLAGEAFPWGTLAVNVAGSLAIGVFSALTSPAGRADDGMRLFVAVGLCGGYTTFSSFSLQTLGLMREGHWAAAGANVLASTLLCLLAVWAGFAAGQGFVRAG